MSVSSSMVKDSDDTEPVGVLIDVLSQAGNRLNANIIVASDDGIHWNAVRQAARIIKAVGERSPHGQGNFNFGAIAMLRPYGPFYPGAWHAGGPRSVAIGLEAANVVMDVFSREHDPRSAGAALTDALAVHLRAVEAAGGVDTVPLPGDTSEAATAAIVGDVATLAFRWNKPLAARLLPAPGKKAGEMTEFSGALSNAIIQPLPESSRK